MTKQQTVLAALCGVALMAALPSQGQITANGGYNDGNDLLLNFRNVNSTTTPDVEVDLGSISTITGLPAHATVVLDSGAWGTGAALTASQTSAMFSLLGGVPSTSSPIGLSAMGDGYQNYNDAELWLTANLNLSSAPTTVPAAPSKLQGNATAQDQIANIISAVGSEASSGAASAVGTATDAGAVQTSDGSSYNQLVLNHQGLVSFGPNGYLNPNVGFEGGNNGSANVYLGLFDVAPKSEGGVAYDGFFTFFKSGEVTYTEGTYQQAQVPEASSDLVNAFLCALPLGGGLLGLRRKSVA